MGEEGKDSLPYLSGKLKDLMYLEVLMGDRVICRDFNCTF